MLYTLAQAREAVKRFVNSGSCRNETLDQAINEALERLIAGEDWECLRQIVRINVYDKVFPLPYCAEKIIHASLSGVPARIYGTAYQFLSSGPGDLDYRGANSGLRDLVDKGDDWPVMYDIPKYLVVDDAKVATSGFKLAAFGEPGLAIRIKGCDDEGVDLDEELTSAPWVSGGIVSGAWGDGIPLTAGKFHDVYRVWIPSTTSYTRLYAVDPATNYMFFLAAYHPSQRIPTFRRYMITNATAETFTSVLAQIKMRHVPLVDADDVAPLPGSQALKLMVMAISAENAKDLQNALAYEAQARRVMSDSEKSRTMSSGTPVTMNHDYRLSLGRHINRRGMIL